jgi:tetratricopeptide (TPR) repeat protein
MMMSQRPENSWTRPRGLGISTWPITIRYVDASSGRQVIEKDPNDTSAYLYLGQEAAKAGDLDTAMGMARTAETMTLSAEDYAPLGYLYHTVGMPHEAVTAYSQAEKLGFKDKGWLYSGTSGCYLSLQEYNRSLSIAPDDEYTRELLYECREALWGTDFGDNY